MDQTQLQQQIATYYSRLSPNLQQVFSGMTWMDNLKLISIKYGLNDKQIETLGTETTLALLGIVNPDEYEKTLGSELGLQSTVFDKMLVEINSSILRSIRTELSEAYDKHVEYLVEEKYGNSEKLDERFSKLPKEVQTAVTESNYQQTLYSIASKFKLSVEQMGILEEITNKVLLGIIHPDKYESELKDKLNNISPEKITELVKAVNEDILKNIREILKSHWQTDKNSGLNNVEGEIPIPPYAIKSSGLGSNIPAPKIEPSSIPKIQKQDSDIYKKAGISMIEDKELDEDEDLNKSIIASKLNKITMSQPIVSDHSLPKIGSEPVPQPPSKDAVPIPPPSKLSHDPYHEEIK